MPNIKLRVHFPPKKYGDQETVKTIQFDDTWTVKRALEEIHSKANEAKAGVGGSKASDFGLYQMSSTVNSNNADAVGVSGRWLDPEHELQYYLLRDNADVKFRYRMRKLKIQLLDNSVKSVMVDESLPIEMLMPLICEKIGVTNAEEYSLVRYPTDETDAAGHGTGTLTNGTGTLRNGTLGKGATLRRQKGEQKVDQKMEQLRRKLKTDDDLDWVDHSKTLEDQEIMEEETLIFRRKFFYSDQNVDSNDPMQLHLLFVQTRDAIINGTHPVTETQACAFAGLQCQIEFGDHVEGRRTLDLKTMLPREYSKQKGVEKRIFMEHRRHMGISASEAKVRYVRDARSLKTYGVTFFLVKEKMQGKNKLVPRLLGVTKDSVLRLDERTKEVLKTWPLTTVKRWAPTPNSFTLDFGDYSDQYYSVQTPEGEQIAKLIAGYIDIILRRKKAKDHLGIDGDEASAMLEDSISPSKATIMQHKPDPKPCKPIIEDVAIPGIIRSGTGNEAKVVNVQQVPQESQMPIVQTQAPTYTQAPVMPAQHPKYLQTGMSEPKKALSSTIGFGQDAVERAQNELEGSGRPPSRSDSRFRGNELDVKKETVASQVAALNAATAQVLSLTSVPEEEVDHPALGAAINTITTNLPEMTRDVKTIANLVDDNDRSDRLMGAARSLCTAFSDLLKAAEPGSGMPRQNIVNAANKVSDASSSLLYAVKEDEEVDQEATDKLLSLAKNVANATATLVRKAKAVASQCPDQSAKNRVISAATQCALATSQLVSCAKVVAPTIHSPNCQKQVVDSAREVSRAVEGIGSVCRGSLDDPRLNGEVNYAAEDVNTAIEQLLAHVRSLSDGKKRNRDGGAVDTILDATDRLFSSSGDASEMVKQAKILAQATSQLIQNIKGQAEGQSDSDIQKRLLGAAKTLADATTRLVEAAKGCASNPHDSSSQAALRQAAEDLRSATSSASSNVLKRKIMARLEGSAKHAAAVASQSIGAAQGAAHSGVNPRVQQELQRVCQITGAQIPPLVSGVRGVQAEPNNSSKQSQLITACEAFLEPANSLATVSRSAIPTVQDKSIQLQMTESTQNLGEALVDLRDALGKAIEACSFSMQIEAAIQQLREINDELEGTRRDVIHGTARPLAGESVDSCANQLNAASKSVVSSIAQLLSATSQGEETYISTASREVTERLKSLANAAKGVASTSQDREVQMKMLDGACDIMQQSMLMFEEIRWAMENQQDAERHARLTAVAKALSNSLQTIVAALPSHKEIDESIQEVIDGVRHASLNSAPTSRSYAELQNQIAQAAQRLSSSTSEVISSTRSTSQLGASSKNFTQNFINLSQLTSELASQSTDLHARSAIQESTQNVASCSANFLQSAKNVSQNPNSGNGPSQLASTARSVTESLSNLLNACSLSAPGQKECDQAIANIQMMRSMLDQPYQMSGAGYFECLESVTERSRHLGDAMTGIANHARKSEHERFGQSVKEASDSICGLLEGAVQSAYLIGASDPSSVSGRPGVVDIVLMQRCADQLHSCSDVLLTPSATKDQLIRAVTEIANTTHSLINACKNAPSKHFVQSAKSVTMSTAELVREIRAINNQNVDQVRNSCRVAVRPLMDGVDQLMSIASSPEFAPVPAKIPAKARQAQEPIISYGKSIIDASCSMIGAAKGLALDPKDPPGWQTLANHSKNVSDSIKRLVTAIKDAAPGQNECDEALERIRNGMNALDQAGLDAINRTLPIREENNLKGFREVMSQSAYQIDDAVDRVRSSGKSHAEKLGHSVSSMTQYFEPLVQASIGYASKIPDSTQQKKILDASNRICEYSLSFVYPVKECGGNPKAQALHAEIEDGANNVHNAVKDLQHILEIAASADGQVSSVVDIITKSISRLDERYQNGVYTNGSSPESLSYVDYQTRMVSNTKEIVRISKDMIVKASSQVNQLGSLATKLAHVYAGLVADVNGISSSTNNLEIAGRIKSTVQDLGAACIDLTKCSGEVQVQPDSAYAQREMSDAARNVAERAGQVLAVLQSGSRGTQACIEAANLVMSIISDIDTTIMFANSGTLNADDANDTFAIHKDDILKTAKALVEDTKTLVAGAASSQEQLAVAAQNAVSTITQLAEAVKSGAATLGSQNCEAQVMLLHSVKDVAIALSDLIESTKTASGKNINDPAMMQLKDSAKVMVTNVTSLLKTVKTVEDEQARGTRALESTIDGIDTEIRNYFSGSMYMNKDVTPEEMIRATKPVTLATTKAVAAGTSGKQDDVIVVANMARKAIHDLLQVCRSASNLADNDELRSRILDAGKTAAQNYQELLRFIFQNLQRPLPIGEAKQKLMMMSRVIAQSVTEIVALAEMLKSVDWVDPDDPTVIAENELLGAASSIEAAAQKLAKLQPRQGAVKLPHEDMNFDEIIIEAAKSITQATAMLIRAASSAQKELVATGKADLNSSTYSDDDQWSEGLIGAARTVAAATHSLVEAANALVQGQASEEKLISAAKQVASCTAQLLVACKVKADPESQAMRRLQAAGNAVKKATDNLVRAAQQAIEQEEEQSLIISKRRVAGMTQEIIAREVMLTKEKELIEARAKLAAINKARYGNKNGPQDQDYGFPAGGQSQFNQQSYSYEYSSSQHQH